MQKSEIGGQKSEVRGLKNKRKNDGGALRFRSAESLRAQSSWFTVHGSQFTVRKI
jgi:hypothetical protein